MVFATGPVIRKVQAFPVQQVSDSLHAMRRLTTAAELNAGVPVCAAIGVFDGVHQGHREILQRIQIHAAARGGVSLVITFDQHPSAVVAPERAPLMISTLSQRLRLLEEVGIDAALVLPFNEDLSRVPGEDFVRGLVRNLATLGSLTVGEDFTFGHKRSGDVRLLRRLGDELGFNIEAVDGVELDGERVSSTRIRELIQVGDLGAAARFLGRNYSLAGKVVEGDRLGRTIGFPTANIGVVGLVTPPFGVYAGRTVVEGKTWRVALNVGVRPTLDQATSGLRVEAHLIDFEGELVGQELEIEVLFRLRPEMKFRDLAALSAQIREDVAVVRQRIP
jgi:riboflavin kinase / FMN adenylyltransferase